MRPQYAWTKNKLVKDLSFKITLGLLTWSSHMEMVLRYLRSVIWSIPMKVKIFPEEFFGNSIQFCKSDRQNQSSMVFCSSIDITDFINTLQSLDSVKSAAQTIRDKLLNVDFGLQDKFCDAEELKMAWGTTKILD